MGYSINAAMADNELKPLFPEWMQLMPVNFLGEIQILHDKNSSWSDDGLSPVGLMRVENIRLTYASILN